VPIGAGLPALAPFAHQATLRVALHLSCLAYAASRWTLRDGKFGRVDPHLHSDLEWHDNGAPRRFSHGARSAHLKGGSRSLEEIPPFSRITSMSVASTKNGGAKEFQCFLFFMHGDTKSWEMM
jgi:hypothetical protein